MPGDDAATNGLTVVDAGRRLHPEDHDRRQAGGGQEVPGVRGQPGGLRLAGQAVQAPSGPFVVRAASCPADVPPAIKDMQPYFDARATSSLALEFLSPIKGPALEQITVEVGSGIRRADDGAALYDQDVKKQAQQLGLPGW